MPDTAPPDPPLTHTPDLPNLLAQPKHGLSLAAGQILASSAALNLGFGASARSLVVRLCPRQAGTVLRNQMDTVQYHPGVHIACRADGRIVVHERNGAQALPIGSIDLRAQGIDIYDGHRHTLAYVASGQSAQIWLDGQDVTDPAPAGAATNWPTSPNPINALTLGGADPFSTPVGGPLAADFYSIGLWNRALNPAEIDQAAMGFLTGLALEMQAYWPLNGDLKDISPNAVHLGTTPSAAFFPSVHATSLLGRQWQHAYCQIDAIPHPNVEATRIDISHTMIVPVGAAYLFGAISTRGDSIGQPSVDVVCHVVDPTGVGLDQNYQAPCTVITRHPDGGILAFVIENPTPGTWWAETGGNAHTDYVFQMQAVPAQQALPAVFRTLFQILAGPQLSANGVVERDLGGSDWSWLELVSVGALAGVIFMASGGTAAPVLLGLLGAVGVARAADSLSSARSRSQTADFVFNPHGERTGVLVLDANSGGDQGANAVYRYRKQFLYRDILQNLDPQRFQVHLLIEQKDNLAAVQTHLLNPIINYVTASGHGTTFEYLGWNNQTVISDSKLPDDRMIRGKIFHMVACNTGFSLGPALIRRGARAFIGYKDKYGITTDGVTAEVLASATVQASTKVDEVLLAGGTAQAAFDAAIALYKVMQKQMFVDKAPAHIQERLQQNRLLLVLLGDANARVYSAAAA